MKYDFKSVEKKWQDKWAESDLYRAPARPGARKCYALNMFPYPSGAGLHVGHPLGYTATDIYARKRMMEGYDVLNPMGWDAFGLPAENYAIKTGIHPRESTWKNIDNFRRQLKSLGFSFDWSREVNTADPSYYRWTQWLFLFLYRHGLAYKKEAPVNWCSSCQTVLANEQVEGGACERCKTVVEQKRMSQWFLKVTAYADRLLEDLAGLDWPDKIKAMQTNWIGRSEGAEIVFRGTAHGGEAFEVPVFTTRPDTLCGVSFVVLAPEHPLVDTVCAPSHRAAVEAYQAATKAMTEIERTGADREKTGVALGVSVVNPLTGEAVPLLIADYALANYGTGAVMGVAAHDDRDYAFAKKYDLPVRVVIVPPEGVGAAADAAYTEPGFMVNSGAFDGLSNEEAKEKIVEALAERGAGKQTVTYHLRDWLVSRQRYWGAPIPIMYCERCGEVPVPEQDLPVLLPDDVDFRPDGVSPLARSESFHNVRCPECGGAARRETDTMDGFADNSWYFLRYCSPHDGLAAFNHDDVAAWMPIDMYVGGAEHAVKHLLYARFFTKALADHGLLPFDEPFTRLRNQGLIMGEDGQKMSKSLGNVVNPDDVVEEFGADAMRAYLMFMGEFEEPKNWSTKNIVGVRRFLDRLDSQVHDTVHGEDRETPEELLRVLHRTIKKVSADIEAFKFNTAIAALMIALNEWQRLGGGDREAAGIVVRLTAPFAPHLGEDLWELLGHEESVFRAPWPVVDEALCVEEEAEMAVQVNGKVRDRLTISADADEAAVTAAALALPKVAADIGDRRIVKVVVVKGKLVSVAVA
jgi:leucyl-tRNA synthetase